MPAPLLALRDIHLSFGGTPLIESADLTIEEGDRLCLVGRNGSGKSTLLKIAAGQVEADRGTRVPRQGLAVAYLPQEPDLDGFPTVLDYAAHGLDSAHRAQALLADVGLTGTEDPARLSGGEARRAMLARTLARGADVLLLDEPTNHLDLPAIEWLEAELAASRAAIVLISHDRRFLERLSRATVWLDRGATRRLDRGFPHFEAWRDELLAREELERHKLGRRLAREIDWLHYGGVTARRRRNEGRKRALDAMRARLRDARGQPGTVRFTTGEADASGKLVIEAKGVGKTLGGRVIIDDFSARIGRGDRVGIVGPNGAGKTTLLKLLTGTLSPDTGTIRLGAGVELATLDQGRQALRDQDTVAEVLTGGRGDTVVIGDTRKHVASYMQDFLFLPEQARTPTLKLSGGERGRLLLARALATPSNLLVLDEPTNDLDLETLDVLQEMLAERPGTVLLVSHDRDFLDRVASSIIAYEAPGRFVEYAGGYSDMVAQRGSGVGARVGKKTVAPKIRPAARGATATAKHKLSFKDKHALETLPRRIAALEAEIASLDTLMSDAGAYARDAGAFTAASTRIAAARGELGEAEDAWLELAMRREEVGG